MKKRTLGTIIEIIDSLVKRGALKSDEHLALRKAAHELRHAINTKDMSLVEKAVNKIAKLLLKM